LRLNIFGSELFVDHSAGFWWVGGWMGIKNYSVNVRKMFPFPSRASENWSCRYFGLSSKLHFLKCSSELFLCEQN
jgi:hypothetical protein